MSSACCVIDALPCVHLGITSEGFPCDSFNEQTANDLPNKDGGAWVLGYRAGPPCPFLLHEEREKSNRSELYLDLNVSGNLRAPSVVLCGQQRLILYVLHVNCICNVAEAVFCMWIVILKKTTVGCNKLKQSEICALEGNWTDSFLPEYSVSLALMPKPPVGRNPFATSALISLY